MRELTIIVIIASCLLVSSALWYAISHQHIIVASSTEYFSTHDRIKNKEMHLYWYRDYERHEDTRMVLWSEQPAERIKNIVNGWLTHLQEEKLIPASLHVESVAFISQGTTQALINFSDPLMAPTLSIFEKACLLEGLLMTLRLAEPALTQVRFLMRNSPAVDEHIDMGQSFPTAGFFTSLPAVRHECTPLHTFVINPAGDSKATGRIINREFERTLTLEAATLLAQSLRDKTVILTRTLGQTIDQLHILHTVNQRPTDLFIDLRCYQTKSMVPEIHIYSYCARPETDFWHKKSTQLALVPISKTYLKHAAASYAYAATITQKLAQDPGLRVSTALALPVTPLVGLTQPSIIIECGIRDSSDLTMICHKLAAALSS